MAENQSCRWTTYKWSEFDQLPAAPGVYAVYANDKLVYIGSAGNIKVRLRSHEFTKRRHGGYHWRRGYAKKLRLKCREERVFGEALMAEARLIRRLRPPLNRRVR